jgi:hypothetical protein
MDERVLRSAMSKALLEIQPQVEALYLDKHNDPIAGTEAKFSAALGRALNNRKQHVLCEVPLKCIGAYSYKSGQRSQSGNIDILVVCDTEFGPSECYALELKCVGLPSKKGPGYNAAQIAEDALRILSTTEGHDVSGIGLARKGAFWGGWVIILNIENEADISNSDDTLLERFHTQMYAEYLGYKSKCNEFVGRSKEAFQAAGFAYLGFIQPFDQKLRPNDSYFGVKIKGSRVGAIAAWVGW